MKDFIYFSNLLPFTFNNVVILYKQGMKTMIAQLFQVIFSLQFQLSPLFVGFGRTQSLPNRLVEGSVALD